MNPANIHTDRKGGAPDGPLSAFEAELQYARDRLKKMEADLAGRTSQLQIARTELEAERAAVAELKATLEAERAARARLVDALQTVQRAVSFGDADSKTRAEGALGPPAVIAPPEPAAVSEADSIGPPLKLVGSTPAANPEIERELVAYAQHLFDQILSIYLADVSSAEDSVVAVDRLTANLRHAHRVFTRRLQFSNAGDSKVFEEQLAALLDREAQTSFGRHLAVAAYSYAASVRAEAS